MSTTTARYAGVLARASLLPLSMLLPLAALAQGVSGQDAPGMIVIPGNGEPASTSPRTAQPGMQSGAVASMPQRAADADVAFAQAARNAQIVIPGNGEVGAQAAPLGQTPRSIQNNRNGADAVTNNAAQFAGTTRMQAGGYRSEPRPSATDEPALDPAVAALLAGRDIAPATTAAAPSPSTPTAAATSTSTAPVAAVVRAATAPAAPRAELLQLQKQAATELHQDATASGSNANAAPTRGSVLTNVPTARSMPALQSIPAGPILGAVRPPGSRLESVVVNTPARQIDAPELESGSPDVAAQAGTAQAQAAVARTGSVGAARTAGRTPANDPAAATARDVVQPVTVANDAPRTQAQARTPRDVPVNVATNVPANAAPVAHSVTVVAPSAALVAAAAAPTPAGKQDPALIMKTAEDFLRQQAAGLPGRVTLSIPPIAPRGLIACDNLQAFMAPGAPMWGRTTVGVRCTGAKPWTIYLLARVSVQATYYVAGRSISPGDVIQLTDLVPREGDLSVMPRAIVTDPSQVVGAVAENRISAGLPLRSDLIRSPQAIQLGQTVKVVAQGDGFSISTDGNAMNNASPGQQVRVKTSSGQMVVGTASGKGVVQIPM